MSIRVIARFFAKPDSVNQIKPILIALVEPIRNDPGCISCHLVNHASNTYEFTFIEEWASENAFNAHLAEPFVKQAVVDTEALLANPLELHVYKPI
jgi:quinol monooxygenase YgiN